VADVDGALRELVDALCHEVGNLLAAARLLGAVPDAAAAAGVARGVGRAGALVALIPPLVGTDACAAHGVRADPLEVLGALRRGLDAEDDARVRIELRSAVDLAAIAIDGDVLLHVLIAQILAALDSGDGGVRVVASAAPGAVRFRVEGGALDADGQLRAPALARAAAGAILAARGGRVERAGAGLAAFDLFVPVLG
jgi:hypothetical protein